MLKLYLNQKTPNYNSNIHFWPLRSHWGTLEGQNLQGGVVGFLSFSLAISFCFPGLVWVIRTQWGWSGEQFLTTPYYPPTLPLLEYAQDSFFLLGIDLNPE